MLNWIVLERTDYLHKIDLALNNLQRLICHKTQEANQPEKKHRHSRISGYGPKGGCPRGVMLKAMYCGIVVSEFELQSRYYVHFRANTLEKGMNPLILPAMG